MTKKESRKGYALGAIFALIATLFVGAAPAQAAATDGGNIAVRAVSGNDSANALTGLVTEDFSMYAQLLPGVTNDMFATASAGVSNVVWLLETSSLYDIIVATDTEAVDAIAVTTTSRTAKGVKYFPGSAASFSASVDAKGVAYSDQNSGSGAVSISAEFTAGGLAHMAFKAVTSSTITSASPNAVVTITIFIDEVGGTNGVRDADEWYTTKTVTLYGSDNLASGLTVDGAITGGKFLTTSATVAVNHANLGGEFYVYGEVNPTTTNSFQSASGSVSSVILKNLTAATMALRGGVITASNDLGSGLPENTTYSFAIYYSPDATLGTASDYVVGSWVTRYTSVGGASAISLRMDNDGANVTGSSNVAKTVRLNQTYTVWVGATTASGGTSVSGVATSVEISGPDLVFGTKEIKVNGGDWTTSYPTALAVTTGANGYGAFTIQTRGFVDTNALTFAATSGGRTAASLTATGATPAYRVQNDYTQYQTTPGTGVVISWTVRDQWNVLSSANHQLVVTKGGSGFSYTQTQSTVAVSAGRASFTFVPEAATTTGSATLQADGYVADTNGAYVVTGMTDDANVSINVSSAVNSFTTGLAGSYSSSVSYFPSTLSWVTIAASAANTGSSVVVTAPAAVVFKDVSGVTASGTITVRVASNNVYTFYATSEVAGTYTMTLTNGTATTTSLLIVDPVSYSAGTTITFDTTEIVAGRTKIVTGTLTDDKGNPVATGDTASIVVVYSGTAGIPVGSMPTATDADGKFRVSVLTSTADSGTFTLTATYNKDGASTATADKITKVQAISVGAASAAPSADQKVNAGSFKGYVAVYAKGYEGQRLSAKVGNDWVVVPALASNFVRVVEFTGAGYTIAVRIYIDRVLVDTITVTTK